MIVFVFYLFSLLDYNIKKLWKQKYPLNRLNELTVIFKWYTKTKKKFILKLWTEFKRKLQFSKSFPFRGLSARLYTNTEIAAWTVPVAKPGFVCHFIQNQTFFSKNE